MRLWKALSILLLLLCLPALGEDPVLPNHNIVLFQLDEKFTQVSSPRLVAITPEYENQPCFAPDSSWLVYTRMEGEQADIWRWESGTGQSRPLIKTELSEYSPTFVPGQNEEFSTVRVEADGTQRLWRYSAEKGFELIFSQLKPVGYHVWCGSSLGLFILGEPNTLQIAELDQEKATPVAEKIGRCLSRVPGSDRISFTVEDGKRHRLQTYDLGTKKTESLQLLPAESQDYLWLNKDTILSSDGSRLLKASAGSDTWEAVENTSTPGLSGITRLALSPDKKLLAVVYEQK